MSERQTKRRRKAQTQWVWFNETGEIDPDVWNAHSYTFTGTTTAWPPIVRFTHTQLDDVWRNVALFYDRPDLAEQFDPRTQGPPRPLEDLVQSVLDYEGLEDEL